jgi:hypothetical protein
METPLLGFRVFHLTIFKQLFNRNILFRTTMIESLVIERCSGGNMCMSMADGSPRSVQLYKETTNQI